MKAEEIFVTNIETTPEIGPCAYWICVKGDATTTPENVMQQNVRYTPQTGTLDVCNDPVMMGNAFEEFEGLVMPVSNWVVRGDLFVGTSRRPDGCLVLEFCDPNADIESPYFELPWIWDCAPYA